jgi:UDP-N-acetylglucosamine transferase subunit ALG13
MAKVLVAVLDWGLGHASRSSRIIQILMNQKHEVVVASSGPALQFLKSAFPALGFYELPAYNIRYSSHRFLLAPFIVFHIPQFLRLIRKENQMLHQIISKEHFNLIISDNRYGVYSRQVHSVFLCHQLTIPVSGIIRPFRKIVSLLHARLIKRFDTVWVPDFPDLRFSGFMGICPGLTPQYIGMLSRFSPCTPAADKKFFITAIISGPNPQRTRLTENLEQILSSFDQPCLLLTGTPGAEGFRKQINQLTILNHAETQEMQKLICSSTYIIARSGYSSVMDFAVTGSRVIFIPTPGQPEQEYIAQRMQRSETAVCLSEHKLTRQAIENLLIDLKSYEKKYEVNFTENFLATFPPLLNTRATQPD